MADELEPIKQVINIDVNETGADEATKDISKLNTTISQTTTENKKSEESFKSFKSQLKEANAELQKTIQIHGETSKEAIAAAKAVAELKDQMGFAKDLADNFNPDQKFKALGAATQIAATSMQGVTAGMALFGDQSEDTEKALLKVQSAMAFSDAISGLSNLGDQWQLLKTTIQSSSIATKANTAATGAAAIVQNLFTGSVNTTSKGFKTLKLAIAGTGIGLLVVGLALVITNFDKIQKVVLRLVPGLAQVGEVIGNIVNSVTDFIGVTSEADRAIERMKDNADASLALNKKFLAEHGSQLDEFTKQKIEAKNKYNEAIKEDGADQIALAKELNRELAAIEYSRGDEQRKIQKENAEKAQKEAEERAEEARLKRLEQEKLAAEKAKADREALNQFQIDTFNAEMEQKRLQDEQELERLASVTAAVEKIEEDSAKKELDIEIKKAEQKKAIQEGQLNLAESAVGFLSNIAGKNKALQKGAIIADSALGIGKSVIATNASNVAATAEGAALAIPTGGASVAAAAGLVTANYAALALGTASNIAATAKALSALGGGGVSGGGNSPASTPSRNVAQVGFQGSSENQISTAIAQQQKEQPPIQAFVVSQAVTDQQELDRKKELNNSF